MKFHTTGCMAGIVVLGLMIFTGIAYAKSGREIDASVDTALDRFQREVPGGKDMLNKAEGILVFPSVIKAGIGLGGEYGTGALRVKGKTADYYNTVSGSVGFQLGGQIGRAHV